MSTTETKKFQNVPVIFCCKICDYNTSRRSQYDRHLLTVKHIKSTKFNSLVQISSIENKCNNCGKNYKDRSGLWKHKKICNNEINKKICNNEINKKICNNENINETENTILDSSSNEIKVLTNLVIELVKNNTELQKQTSELQKQNQDFQKQTTELQKQIIDVCQKIQPGNNTTINSHNNNKTFNLQLFLNEECKDAMNMSEFINSIQLKLSDLENIGTLGYTEGMSKIILNEMSGIDQNKRPVHCTDIKRDILYVKEEDKWEKEQPEYPKLKQAIRRVEQKNFGLMGEWQAEHPDYKDSTTHENTEFLKLVSQTMSGTPENMHKVIKRIAKEVVIDK